MSGITFERAAKRLDHPRYGIHHSHDFAACSLARPIGELRALASMIGVLPWTGDTFVRDATLYIHLDYRAPYAAQERSFHAILGIAREMLDEAVRHLRTTTPKVTPEPFLDESGDPYRRYASCYLKDGGVMRMPKDHYGAGFTVVREKDGLRAYFLTSDSYDCDTKPLAATLLGLVMPEIGIGACQEMSYGETAIERTVDGLRDMGVMCHDMAYSLHKRFKDRVGALQWGGQPSSFTDEDDDARDLLLARMRAGETVLRTRREDAGYNDIEGNWTYTDGDGLELSGEIVERLLHARLIQAEDGPFGDSNALVAPADAKDKGAEPRKRTVRFQAFQSYCQHRRHWEETECTHRDNHCGGDRCSEGACPLVSQVYSGDYGDSWQRRFDDDPAFNPDDRYDHDPLVIAHHRNTERSFAWRSAGQDGMLAVVNTVLSSHFNYGAPFLVEASLHAHAHAAVAAGHLEIVNDMPGFGLVMKPTGALLETVAEQRAARDAHAAAQADAVEAETTR